MGTLGVAPGTARPSRGRRRWVRGLIVVLLLLVVGVFTTERGQGFVAPTVVRLRLALPSVFGDGEYAFLNTAHGQPVTFGSCDPVRIVLNEAKRPVEGIGLVEEAVEEASKASGIPMEIVGGTDELPSLDRATRQARYGSDWAPVLIAWTTPEDFLGLRIGIGAAQPMGFDSQTGTGHYVSGQIALDSSELTALLEDGRTDEARAVVMHELAHIIGLAHVDSPYELMHERIIGLDQYGPGDRAGLALLGDIACG
jgi:hypothetical protein